MTSSEKIVLIVDDNLDDRYTYRRCLNQDAINIYQIIEAETGTGRKGPGLVLLFDPSTFAALVV